MNPPELIDVSAQPAIASWTHETGGSRRLEALRFHIYHSPSNNTAFFKLRATVAFQATGAKFKRTTAAWLHFAPENIKTIILEDEESLDDDIRKQVGPNAVCWRFCLARPGILVLPPDFDVKSKTQSSDSTLDDLWSIARATSFSVSASLPARTVSRARLLSLCTAASRRDSATGATILGALSPDSKLISNKHAADTSSLYGGKGGQIVAVDSLDLPGPASDVPSPPPYADVGPSPPTVAATVKGTKRRRRTSSDASGSSSRKYWSKDSEEKPFLTKAAKDELKSELLSEIRNEIKTEVKEQVKTELLREVMQEVETRILGRVEELIQEQDDAFEKQLYDLRHEVGATIYSEVEDQTYAARKELEDFVQEEMDEAQKRVEDRIVDRVGCADLYLRFPDR